MDTMVMRTHQSSTTIYRLVLGALCVLLGAGLGFAFAVWISPQYEARFRFTNHCFGHRCLYGAHAFRDHLADERVQSEIAERLEFAVDQGMLRRSLSVYADVKISIYGKAFLVVTYPFRRWPYSRYLPYVGELNEMSIIYRARAHDPEQASRLIHGIAIEGKQVTAEPPEPAWARVWGLTAVGAGAGLFLSLLFLVRLPSPDQMTQSPV